MYNDQKKLKISCFFWKRRRQTKQKTPMTGTKITSFKALIKFKNKLSF